jgi:DNA invertase Pin-like site-specific DNA recombinase
MTKKVAIYARVSTDKQTCENQLIELREVADRNNWEIVGEYVDTGISGAKGRDQRPQFDLLIKDGIRKKYEMILAYDVSRLSRSLQDLVQFMNDLNTKGINLFLMKNGISTDTPSGKMMFQMCGVFAEFERTMISERIKSGMQRAKKEGRSIGRKSNMNDSLKTSVQLLRDKGMGIRRIASTLGIGVGTVYSCIT